MDAMDRLRRRVAALLNDRKTSGKIRQKALSRHLDKSEAWLSNILKEKRGVRVKDLDAIAEFFHIPPAELIRASENDLMEVSPLEAQLLRRFRRASSQWRESILHLIGMSETDGNEQKTLKRR